MSWRDLVLSWRRPAESLEVRLVGSFLGLSLVVLGITAGVAYRSARRNLIQGQMDHLNTTAALKQGELDRWILEQTQVIRLLASLPETRAAVAAAGDPDARARLADLATRTLQASHDFVEVFFLSGTGGRVLASSDPEHVGSFHVSDPFFLVGRSRPYVQNVYPSPETGRPTLTLSTPVAADSGAAQAVLAAHLDLNRMDGIIQEHSGLGATAEAYLVTSFSDFVSARRFGRAEYRRGVHSAGVSRALAGESGTALYDSYAGTPVIGAYRWIPARELALLVEVSQDEALSAAHQLLRQILMFGLAATLLLAVGVRWIALSVARPVAAVADAAAMVADGDFTVFAPEKGRDEVGNLARSFNSMTDQLRDLYSDLQGQIQVTSQTLTALEESRSLLQAIADNSPALVAVTGPEGHIQIANRRLLALLGMSSQEAVGRRLGQLLPDTIAGEWLAAKNAAFELRHVVEREVDWPTEEGPRTFLCVWFPLTDGGSRPFGVGMIATDLTERKRAEEERLRFEAQIRHAQKLESLGVLAGGIAHDFNNILAAILGHADLARESRPDGETLEHLDQVVAAAQRASGLTNQMLAYAGRASFRVETVDINRAIDEISNLVSVSLPKKVAIETRLWSGPLPVRADPAQISQVVMNLVTNAAQAVGDAPGRVTLATRPSRDGSLAELTVTDTGCGMDRVTVDRIFDPFFTTKEAGRGLGLAAVIGIVSGLGGDIHVDSEPGRGTTFRVSIPLMADVEAGGARGRTRAEADVTEGTILVVDDEDAVRGFTRRALERKGFQVLEACDGLEALEVMRRDGDRVHAVVLDMSMPGMGGREVFEELRRLDADLPVLFTSGYDPEDAAGPLTDTRSVRFLQKPFRPVALSEELNELLAGVR